MSKFTGNIIRLPAVTPTQNSASGVYTLDDQFTAQSSGTWPIVRDQYFNYTTLLLTGAVQGTAYPNPVTQPYSFLSDASTNNFVVSPNGDVSARPFNPYLNNYSNFFDGSADFLSISNNVLLQLTNSTAFTIEAWVYPVSIANNPQIVFAYNPSSPYQGYSLRILTSSGLFEMFDGTAWTSFGAAQINTWQHIAVSYEGSGTTRRFFLNGVQQGSAITVPSTINWTSGGLNISSSAESFNGYISNLRIVKGTAVYTSNFTPPTAPLAAITNTSLLTCQSNRFKDSSNNNLTLTVSGNVAVSQNSPFVSYDTTNGSGYFDGTGDYLNAGSSSSLACGSGSFTVETWIYPSVLAQSSIYASTANGGQFFSFASGQGIGVGRVNVAWDYSTNVFPVYYAWNHIVWVRSGSNLSIYLNGTRIGNTTNSQNYTLNGGSATIGTEGSIASTIPGCYISNFRVAPGTAIYDPTLTTLTNTLTGATGVPTAPLPVVSGTSLLTLQTRAPATNNGFIDSSPNNFVVTRNGNTTQGSFSPFSPTGWSNLFNGSNNGLTVPASSAFSFSGEFTWEAFVCFNAIPGSGGSAFICSSRNTTASNSSFQFGIYNRPSVGTEVNITLSIGGTDYGIGWAITTPTIGVWYHVAVVRNASNTVSCYWDGSLKTLTQGSASAPGTTNTPTVPISVGYRGTPNNDLYLNGYISNLRMVASALYSGASITIPTAAFSPTVANTRFLTCQSNRFAETSAGMVITLINSPSVQAFSPFAPAQSYIPSQIGGSGYFDGTGSGTAADYLTVPDSPVFTFGSGDFTVEFWFYPTLGSTSQYIFNQNPNVATNASFAFLFTNTNTINAAIFSGSTEYAITSSAIALNAWHHAAIVRSGANYSLFIDGSRVAAPTNVGTNAINDSTASVRVGALADASNSFLFNGYVSSARIVRGTAVYDPTQTTITVPTAPPTAIPNTSLLLNFTNGGIVDATGKNNLETVANSGVQTSQAKWSPGSMYFDGGGDWLVVPKTGNWSIGSSEPFTIEAWVYLTAAQANYRAILSDYNSGTPGSSKYLFINSSGIEFQLGTTAGTIASCTQSFSQNQWYYIAITRNSSNVISMYVDGTSKTVSQATQSGGFLDVGSFFYVGRWGGATAYEWYGYIDDLRITKGIARTITASPTGPFPLG